MLILGRFSSFGILWNATEVRVLHRAKHSRNLSIFSSTPRGLKFTSFPNFQSLYFYNHLTRLKNYMLWFLLAFLFKKESWYTPKKFNLKAISWEYKPIVFIHNTCFNQPVIFAWSFFFISIHTFDLSEVLIFRDNISYLFTVHSHSFVTIGPYHHFIIF